MKDQKLPLFRVLLSAVILLCFAWQPLHAQNNPEQKQFTILVNSPLVDTIESASFYPPKAIFVGGENYGVTFTNVGGNNFEVEIDFDADYIGHTDVTIEYWRFNPFPTPDYVVFSIDVVPSIVTAQDDVVLKTSDTLTIYPLLNDASSTNSHELISVNQTKFGNSTYAGDSIVYTSEVDEDVILYSIKDSVGTTDQGMILITSEDLSYIGNDTVNYTITNSQSKYLILPNGAYTNTIAPLSGQLNSIGNLAYSYRPDEMYSGPEEILFEDGNGNSRLFQLEILETVSDLGYVKDDEFYTPKDETIIFDVYENDLLKTGILTDFSSELTVVSPGVFSYTPDAGFQGVKEFTYEKNFGITVESGSIKIHVGNQKPTKSFPYEFRALAGKDYNVIYEVPISGYSFTIVNPPVHGSAVTYSINDTVNGQCNSISNRIGILYTPDSNYNGLDEFDIEYCINGSQCEFYKLRFEIIDPVIDSLCNCIENCVWSGDANSDGRVSVTDLLSIGRYMGYGGEARSVNDQGIWSGDKGHVWTHNQLNGKNTMHIDGNSDGVVTALDAASIVEHYGKVHTLVPEEILAIKNYPFYLLPQQTEVDSGDLLVIDIAIGDANYAVKDAHGFTFGLNIPPSFIDSASFDFQFDDNSWFTHHSPSLAMDVHKSEGKIDVGFTRTSGIGISGFGVIGQLSFIVEEDAHGIKTSELLTRLTQSIYLTDARMEDGFGNRYALPDAVATFEVNLNKGGEVEEEKLVLYPNPTDDYFVLHFNGRNTINDVQVYDVTGKMVYQNDEVNTQATQINTSQFHEGIYIVQCGTSKGVISKRVHIQR